MSDMGTCSPGAEGVSDGGEEQSREEHSHFTPLCSPMGQSRQYSQLPQAPAPTELVVWQSVDFIFL